MTGKKEIQRFDQLLNMMAFPPSVPGFTGSGTGKKEIQRFDKLLNMMAFPPNVPGFTGSGKEPNYGIKELSEYILEVHLQCVFLHEYYISFGYYIYLNEYSNKIDILLKILFMYNMIL